MFHGTPWHGSAALELRLATTDEFRFLRRQLRAVVDLSFRLNEDSAGPLRKRDEIALAYIQGV
jgi:hypothetical protein